MFRNIEDHNNVLQYTICNVYNITRICTIISQQCLLYYKKINSQNINSLHITTIFKVYNIQQNAQYHKNVKCLQLQQ